MAEEKKVGISKEEKREKNKKRLSWLIKHRKLVAILAIIILVVLAALYVRVFLYQDEATVTNDMLVSTLEKSSELTTAKLNFKGVLKYEDEGIAIINKSSFIMEYRATVRIGIDIAKVEPTVKESTKTIHVVVPEAEVFDVNVDENTIQYYDTKFALFNVNEKEDGNKAVAAAEKDAKKEAKKMGMIEYANEHAETLIKGILEGVVPEGYTYEFEVKK